MHSIYCVEHGWPPAEWMANRRPCDATRTVRRKKLMSGLGFTGCCADGLSATDGLPLTADAPLQRSELAKSAKTGLMQFTKNASLFDQLAVTGQLLGREIKSAGSLPRLRLRAACNGVSRRFSTLHTGCVRVQATRKPKLFFRSVRAAQ